MNSIVASEELKRLLLDWSKTLFLNCPDLVGVLQFGSTVKSPLKRDTDLDLLLIFERLPKYRMEQFDLTLPMESQMNLELKNKLQGFNIQVSFISKTVEQLGILSSFYLDFVDTSCVWLDPQKHLARLLKNIQLWIRKNGAYKVQRGALWYWVYSSKVLTDQSISFKFADYSEE